MMPTATDAEVGRELPLNALRVLDACSRHLSFTRAAQELRVTQAAVSHQIKLLEQYLGLRLFLRSGRGVSLTAAGNGYLAAVRESLTHLDQATARVRTGRSAVVTCSIATTIATRWLVPRLRGFSLQYPDTTIRLDMTERFVSFTTEPIDVAIRYGDGRWPGLVADLLFREVLVPVCIPAFLSGKRRLERIADLKKHTLLHATASLNDWAHWLNAHSATGIDAKKGLIFDQPHSALQAAADGLGVAIADRSLIQRDLLAGRLVIPFEGGLVRTEGYYVVGKPGTRENLGAGRFWRWLLAQASDGADDMITAAEPQPPRVVSA